MSAAQKKVIDDHCTTEWAVKVASPVGRLRVRRPREDEGRARARCLYADAGTAGGLEERRSRRWTRQWADAVKKAGGDPDAIYKDLEATVAKYGAGF